MEPGMNEGQEGGRTLFLVQSKGVTFPDVAAASFLGRR